MAGRVHLRQRLKSFAYAFRGIGEMLQTESNARIHGVATLLVVLLGLVLRVDRLEWLALVLTIALVFGLEAVNTAFEALCDVASPDHHPRVRRAKDVAAGAVLIAAIAAVIVAALIFGHRLFG
jgi:diacylglycerol kinase (ATP)